MSSACNNFKLDSHDVISKVVCAMCKKCLNYVNHDVCLNNYVNGKKSRGRKHKTNVSKNETQQKNQPEIKKPKKVEFIKRLATSKPRKSRILLRWSPTGRLFDQDGKISDSSESKSQSDCSSGDNACASNTMEPKIKRFPNSTSLLGRLSRFVCGASTQASPPDYELVRSEVMEIVLPQVGGIDDDILLTIKDDILREKLLNVNLLFAKIEALNDNLTPFYDPIIFQTPPTLTSFGESDFVLEEVFFDAEIESDSSDDQSCFDEDVLEKIDQTTALQHHSRGVKIQDPMLDHQDKYKMKAQSPVIHQPPQEISIQEIEDLKQQYLDEMKRLINSEYRDEIKIVELKQSFNVTPSLPIEAPDNSLSMGDEHLNTILATESDEFIKSSVENLIPIPSESEGIPEHMCDVPFHDNSPPLDASPPDYELVRSEVMEIVLPQVGGIDDDILLTIKDDILREKLLNVNLLFAKIEALNDNLTPFYDPIIFQTPPTLTSFGESDFVLEETNNFDNSLPEFITFSNVLFDAEYQSDSSDDQSCSDEDVPEKIFRPLIDEPDCDFEEDIHLIEKLLYDNSSPRPLKEFVSTNFDTKIGSFSPSPIPIKDSDSFMEEINLSFTLDYPLPPGIEDDDYESERDTIILKDLPSNDTLSIPKIESFHFDITSFFRPLAKPPDGNTGVLNIKMMGDISDQKSLMHKLIITLVPHQEKSLDLLSHRGLKTF
nr:hypothetical protein [Tanacetum cinerariifolium]